MQEQRYRQLIGMQADSSGGLIYESPNMNKEIAKILLARARSGDEAPAAAFPAAQALCFYELKPELYGLTCRRPPYEGADEREHARIVHSLVLPESDLDIISWLPIALLRASFWNIGPFSEERSFADVMKVANSPLPEPASAREFVTSQSFGPALLAYFLQALMDRQKTRRSVLLVGDEASVVRWIEAMCLALPTVVRRQVTFSTCEPEPEECYHCSVIGVRPQSRARWSELSDRFHIVDLVSPDFEPVSADCLGHRIARAFCEADTAWSSGLDRLAERLLIRTYRDLERLMATRGQSLESRPATTDEAPPPLAAAPIVARIQSASESEIDSLWGEILEDALVLAKAGNMAVWMAIADWSHDHSPTYLSRRLIDATHDAAPDRLETIGSILDCLATTKTGPLTSFFEACIALLMRSLTVRPLVWADDMRRCADVLLRSRDEHSLMPLLLDPLKENPSALMPTIRHILTANRTLSYLAASQFFGSRTLLKPEILNVNLREPALFTFFEEIFSNAHAAGQLASLTRAYMDSIDRKRHPRDARHALGLALTCLQRHSAPQAEYQDLLAQVPEIAEYPDQHGRYLLAVLSESPIMALPSNVDFQALWNSLNAQAAGTMTSVRPILTYKLTKAHQICALGGNGWQDARATLKVTNLSIPEEDYRSYLSQVLRLLIMSKEPLIEDSGLVDTFGIEGLLPIFVDEYCVYLDAYRDTTDLYGSAASVVVALGERFQFSQSTQDLASRIIRHVGGDCGEEMNKMVRKRYEANPKGMAWWKGVDHGTGRSLIGKLLNR